MSQQKQKMRLKLKGMSVIELKALCKRKGIKNYSTLRKQQLINVCLNESMPAPKRKQYTRRTRAASPRRASPRASPRRASPRASPRRASPKNQLSDIRQLQAARYQSRPVRSASPKKQTPRKFIYLPNGNGGMRKEFI